MVKVTVRNPEYARKNVWQFEQPEFFTYEGDEVTLKQATPDELCLTTGNPEWPVRVIQRRLIESIDGQLQPASLEVKNITKVVKGSKGNEYVVTSSKGRWLCTCPGFQFRKSCKHTQEAA